MLFLRLIRFILSGILSAPYVPCLLLLLVGVYSLGYLIKCIKEIGKQ